MKKIIAILLSAIMALSSVAVVIAAPTDRAQSAINYIKGYTGGEGAVEVRDMAVETLVGRNTPDAHEVEVSRNNPVNFISTLDMQLGEDVFNGMK